MILYTAQYSTTHHARIDITRAGCDRLIATGKPAPGAILAPSASLLRWGLNARKRAKSDTERLAAWHKYEAEYIAEVHERIAKNRDPLDVLLALDEAVFVCFCGAEYAALAQCHRFPAGRLLAEEGADYRGELPYAPPRQLGLFG